jgi:hypothetical protein
MSAIVASVATAVVGAGTSIYSANKSAKASKQAAEMQVEAQQSAISEQRSQFDAIQELLRPYVEAGNPDLTQPYIQAGPGALQGMQGLAGLRGNAEQQAAIEQIKQSAQYQELARQGEQGILQNAAATGGLRGGNVQAALSQFRPALLNQLIESQYGKLAGLTSLGATSSGNLLQLGQAAAAGTAAAGQQSAQNIGNLMVGQGQAQAAGIVGAAQAKAQGLSSAIGSLSGGFQNQMLFSALNTGGGGGGGFGGLSGGGNALSMSGQGLSTPIGGGRGVGGSASYNAALAGQ